MKLKACCLFLSLYISLQYKISILLEHFKYIIVLLFLSIILYNISIISTQTGGFTLKLEWDEDKNEQNLAKHGIDFETAILVFNDLQRIEIYDMEHSIHEDRYNTIGMVNDILFVVYTERKENIRLISARLATKTERSIYYDTDSYFG